jgi:hypothetical protein
MKLELKQTLDNLGFETLPMMSEFVRAIKSGNLFGFAMSETKDFQFDYAKKIAKELDSINEYADFITRPLTLSQFVACKDGVPMEKPKKEDFHLEVTREQGGENEVTTEFREDYFNEAIEEYQKAVDAVIFEGWDRDTERSIMDFHIPNNHTIESFINNGGKLKLK